MVKKDGTVEPAEGTTWKQRDPRMGDIAFMRGGIPLNKGEKEPSAKGDNFTVSWDHVGIFQKSRRMKGDQREDEELRDFVGALHGSAKLPAAIRLEFPTCTDSPCPAKGCSDTFSTPKNAEAWARHVECASTI